MPEERILLVDDEPSLRWVLCEALRVWGYEVAEAESGAQALALLVTTRPAVVLLDINLPDSSGLALLGEIKRRSPHTAVVMVTAEAVYGNVVAALRGGADDFISKPVKLDELRSVLQRVLAARAQGQTPVIAGTPHVLILSDAAERIPPLQSAFHPHEAEVTSVVFPEEWSYAADGRHDVALVDVGPELLEPALNTLRGNRSHAQIPVLVKTSRMAAGAHASVLPKYRALPCSHDEMLQLARHHLISQADRHPATEARGCPGEAQREGAP